MAIGTIRNNMKNPRVVGAKKKAIKQAECRVTKFRPGSGLGMTLRNLLLILDWILSRLQVGYLKSLLTLMWLLGSRKVKGLLICLKM